MAIGQHLFAVLAGDLAALNANQLANLINDRETTRRLVPRAATHLHLWPSAPSGRGTACWRLPQRRSGRRG
jgi:hypothetical protein